MVDYETKAPGVYIEEQTAAGPIVGVGTSTAALIGTPATAVPAGAAGVPVVITNWTGYVTQFGSFKTGTQLPYAVRGFFDNGGTTAYIVPRARRCRRRPSESSSTDAVQLPQPSAQDGLNMKCRTTSCRSPSKRSSRRTGPSGPSKR